MPVQINNRTLTPENFNQSGAKLLKTQVQSSPGNFQTVYMIGSPQGMFSIDSNIAQQLISQGINPFTYAPDASGTQLLQQMGMNTGASGVIDNYNKIFDQFVLPGLEKQAEQQQVTDAQNYNSQHPSENIKGPDIPGLGGIPGTQTLASIGGPTGGGTTGTPAYKIAVPKTTDNPGGFDVYDAQGNKLTYDSLPKGTDGKPLVNLDALPVQSSPTPTGGTNSSGGSSTSTVFDPVGQGYIKQEDWDKMSPAQKAVMEGAFHTAQNQYTEGVANVSMNTKLLNDAMIAAASDPAIVAKYGNALAMDLADTQGALARANQQYASDMGLLQTQQEQDRKKLAEEKAAAGQTYSGFRQQAQDQLATSQSAVISSSQREAQKNIQDLGQSLEQKYGTSGLSQFGNLAIGPNAYTPEGLTGTQGLAKQSDIQAKGVSIFNNERLPTA